MWKHQQQVQGSFSGRLRRILKEPLYVRDVTLDGFLCLFRAAPTAETMSSTSSRWNAVSLFLCRPFTLLLSEFLADVSKKTMPWNLAKLSASSWLTWRSALLASRRSHLLPIRNLNRSKWEMHHQSFLWWETSAGEWLPGYFVTQRVLATLLHPGGQPSEAGGAGDVVDEEHGVNVAVVLLHHRLPEALLSRRVPQLQLKPVPPKWTQKKWNQEERPRPKHTKTGNEWDRRHTRQKEMLKCLKGGRNTSLRGTKKRNKDVHLLDKRASTSKQQT